MPNGIHICIYSTDITRLEIYKNYPLRAIVQSGIYVIRRRPLFLVSRLRTFLLENEHNVRNVNPRASSSHVWTCVLKGKRSGPVAQNMMAVHTGEKLYLCDRCPKTFPKCDDLKKHVQPHTGEKPYSRALCPKTFSRSDNLKRHIHVAYRSKTVFVWNVPEDIFSEWQFDKVRIREWCAPEKTLIHGSCGNTFNDCRLHLRYKIPFPFGV